MKIKEILFMLALLGGMIAPGIWVGLSTGYWHLLWVFLTFFGCFAFWEWHAVKTTGKSVSQQVWKFKEDNPKTFWIFIFLLLISWISLLLHIARIAL